MAGLKLYADRTTFSVNINEIQASFDPNKELGAEFTRIRKMAEEEAFYLAPARSGRLARSIYSRQVKSYLGAYVALGVNTPYAQYVIAGTPPIETAHPMRVPKIMQPSGLHGSELPDDEVRGRFKVRGQRANNFLEKAIDSALRAHGIRTTL
jgi:hypothetical protein